MKREDLKERYADEKNADLAAELGVSVSTVERWAAQMGLKKSAAFRTRCGREGGRIGWRFGGLAKSTFKGDAPWRFKKGRRAFDGALEEKRVKALRDTAWEERKRLMHGEAMKTRWKWKKEEKCV